MDRIKKFLQRLTEKELRAVLKALRLIEKGEIEKIDMKKLVGHKNIYRARIGSIRILFVRGKDDYRIISIERRSDTTYH